jgi:hypothetical protein
MIVVLTSHSDYNIACELCHNLLVFKPDIYSGFQIVGVGAQTHVYGPIDQLLSHVC